MHSQVFQDVLLRVEQAFQGFFSRLKEKNGKAGYPRFKPKGRYDSITYPQESGFRIKDGKQKLSRIGHVKIRMHRSIIGQVKTCTMRRDGDHWYACFSVEYEPAIRSVHVRTIGIDVGLKSFAVLSDGTGIENPRHLSRTEAMLKHRQRELSRKTKGSANRKKTRRIIASLNRKVRNQRSDFHHKEAWKIVTTCGFIVAEDLQIRNMARNRLLSKSIYDAGWGQFKDTGIQSDRSWLPVRESSATQY